MKVSHFKVTVAIVLFVFRVGGRIRFHSLTRLARLVPAIKTARSSAKPTAV